MANKRGRKSKDRSKGDQHSSATHSGSSALLRNVVVFVSLVAVVVCAIAIWPYLTPVLPVVRPGAGRTVDAELQKLVMQQIARVEANPRLAAPRCTLGLIYEANELWAEGEQSFDQCVQLGGTDVAWTYHRALCMRQAGNADSAFQMLSALAAENQTFAPLHYQLAQWQLEAGEYETAAEGFRRARALSPDAVEPMVGLGSCLVELQKYDDAIRLLEQAVASDPSYKPAVYALGWPFADAVTWTRLEII